MPQYASTVSAVLELRENYAAERTPEDQPRDVKYKNIVELAIATRGWSPSAMVSRKQAIGSSDMSTFGDVEVLNALTNTHSPKHNALQQAFQIARSLDQMDNEQDRRVKDDYRLCQARRFPFNIRYLLADIVRSCVDGMSLRRKGRDEVTTERATRFQVLLYLSM
ncbi:hypothetical protein BWQ96_06637 [Gracilariopsis chorda]|uniref:Uncharacterized protein n=1 Tax=Gracilariopsis chorda TaxID=448386 RepID=A0A2V3ING7_9FLOR|nr:hypothetical protein BWQ96_06637 [Gracilariopsis chorda]|eukprot:PXF43628.1 hypothetical protein BWQ96_06637 [Gracilariopsis chorda]